LEPILVIDFGTTYSCAALVVGHQVELIHEPSSGLLGWPSSVLVDGSEILVGSLAESRKRVRASFYRSEIKRYLSLGKSPDIDGQEYRPEYLVSKVLAAFRREAESVYGGPITHAVLTKPAAYRPGDHRNDQMISAGEAAGFPVVELLPEPVAAAFSAPAGERFAPGSLVLVYDWGGGTFDAALVHIGAGDGEAVDSEALPYCGGVDIDEAVAQFICSRDEELSTLFTSGDRGRVAVLDLADRMKRELSERPDSLQEVMGIEAALTVAEFETIAEPFVARTVECCHALLAAAEHAPEDLDAVFMAGGSSKIPLVSRALEAAFGMAPRAARDRELAVVRGAALWASRSESRSISSAFRAANVEPLSWDIPGGTGTLIDWLVAEKEKYPAGAALARVRLPDGPLVSLKGRSASVLLGQHARPGDRVESGYWLATIGATYPEWAVKTDATVVAEYKGHSSYRAKKYGLSVMAHAGLFYLAAGTCCYALDPASGKLQVLFTADRIPAAAKSRSLGNFREIRPGASGDSLLISAGLTRDQTDGDRWFEINRRTGAFIREVTW
jgi:molecular chaperone DnaK